MEIVLSFCLTRLLGDRLRVCVLLWMVELCPGYVAGLRYAELESQLLDFYLCPWTNYVTSFSPHV